MPPILSQDEANAALWRRTDLVRLYANRELRPVEVLLLVRYRDALRGRVLELGCGAGRLTGYLAQIGGDVLAVDVSAQMLAAAAARYPAVRFARHDLREAGTLGTFDAVVAGYNLFDVLGDEERRRLLADLRGAIAPGGLLIFSAHNRAAAWRRRTPWDFILARDPVRMARNLAGTPRRLRNRARVRHLEQRCGDHALLNDESHDFGALHYYIAPDDQARQLEAAGFEVLERLDIDGTAIAPGDPAANAEEVHYVARVPEG